MDSVQLILAISAIVTALSSLGAFRYVRTLAEDATYSRRALDGEKHSRGLIEQADETERRSVKNERALVEADLRTDGGNDDA